MTSFAFSDAAFADLDDPLLVEALAPSAEAARPGFVTPLTARSRTSAAGRATAAMATAERISVRTATAERVDRERARRLTAELEARGFVLHRRIARADLPQIDHLVVAASGVWIVAREHVHCARVSVRRRHLTGAATLRIGGRDRTSLLAPFDDQVSALKASLFDFLDAPVQAALVLPGAEFPLLRSLSVGDHHVLRPAQLLTHLEARGPLKRTRARELAEALDDRLG